MENKILEIHSKYLEKIKQANSLALLDEIFLSLFGKNGEITLIPKDFGKLTKDEVVRISPQFNQIKVELEQLIEQRREEVREEKYSKLTSDTIDITKEAQIDLPKGQIHPITQLEHEVVELFSKIGFQQYQAPHIDTDNYNFELLNIPAGHPARDLWDTLYLEEKFDNLDEGKLLLRTHTSNAQVRLMREAGAPVRMMIIDRCFRYENLDARHEHTLEQFELVYVDKTVNMANLQYLSEYFLKAIFGKETRVRLRPKYYPFVEPGAGVDGECLFCKGKGCKICGGTGWLELAGAGMIHPQVLRNGGINPNEYTGIAWGFGPERMAMLKYEISDIRVFKSGDLKALGGIK
ncbi:MAG: phenylalanine--tRNA ligase subunit alpha [Candidatus Daviesbacteria bacterium]|nr:phenylalanine--tRNA ligase subunit alpha [Candidatus Daviesbacteria bacterium]